MSERSGIFDEASSYYWVPMYLSPKDDFVGYIGHRMIGRVLRDGRAEFAATWMWSNAIGSDTSQDEIGQGYASTKELAVLAAEDHDRKTITARGPQIAADSWLGVSNVALCVDN